jgi:lipoprotein-anchoring transpeptidase ErfK/SrfK
MRFAAVPFAAGAFVLVALAPDADHLAQSQGPRAVAAKQSAEEAVQRTRARGAPVAVLENRVWLRAAPDGKRVARLKRKTEWRAPRVLAVVGARGDWLKVIATELPNGRRGWIPLRAADLVANPWAIKADLSSRVVKVYKRDRLVRRFPVAVGRPSTPTPTGRFAVTDKLVYQSRSAAYGCCALALSGHQPHIEPGWRGGDRLAIHGTQLEHTIGSASSFGCMRARDSDARWVVRNVFLGTVVTIRR